MVATWKRIDKPPTYSSANWRSCSIALPPEIAVRELPGRLVLLGHPVDHSLSPVFQNAALRAAKIPLTYEALDVAPRELRLLLRQLKDHNAAGNVTIPHKHSVHGSCDELTDIAARVGAVNTFWFESGRLHGDNTDVGGFEAAAKALLGGDPVDSHVVLLGSGGAAAAVLAAIEQWTNARVAVVARHPDRAAKLARRFRDVARVEKSLDVALADATLVINATPVGQHNDEMPTDIAKIPKTAAVMDLVYRRGATPWVRAARKRGNRAADGLPMLIEQGALSFKRWFGIEPDREAMRQSLV
ncbi:MAG: shikimate dehydrogenase [Gemmatimonadetes bacterium]|nr:MAG: shikimate dehydrogenase [Gemmatimonadota bacterium]